jgi:ABC-2 type transport system ATP-binding protein
LKGILTDLKKQGKAIILSTHQMNQVEELCDRILMINNGQAVLYGDLSKIKSRYRGDSVFLDPEGELGEVPGVVSKHTRRGNIELILDGKTTPQQILSHLVRHGVVINRFEVATPSLNDIFLKVVGINHE